MEWIKGYKKRLGLIALGICVSTLISCGGASSSSPSAETGTGLISGVAYIGGSDLAQVQSSDESSASRIMGGSFSLLSTEAFMSKLSPLSTDELDREEVKNIANPTRMDGGTAKLYRVDSDGSVVAVATSDVSSTGTFSFPDLAKNKVYLIHLFKEGSDFNGNPKILVIKGIAFLPENSNTATVLISPKTSIIAELIIDFVKNSKGDYTQADLNTFIATTMEELTHAIDEQEITLTTAVNEGDETHKNYTGASSKESSDVATLGNRDSIAEKNKELKAKMMANTNLSKLSAEDKIIVARNFIRAAFNLAQSSSQDKGGGGVPDFYINKFADAYIEGESVTFTTFCNALFTATSITNPSSQATLKNTLRTKFKTELGRLYTYYDTPSGTSTMNNLATIKSIYTSTNRINLSASNAVFDEIPLNAPQAVVAFGFMGLFDENGSGGDIDMSHFDAITFVQGLGFVQFASQEVAIIEYDVQSTSVGKEISTNNWKEVPALAVRMQFAAAGYTSGDVRAEFVYTDNDNVQQRVVLTPQADHARVSVSGARLGQASAAMAYNASLPNNNAITIKSTEAVLTQRFELRPWDNNGRDAITDFKAGKVYLQVRTSQNVLLANEEITIVKLEIEDFEILNTVRGENELNIETATGSVKLEAAWSPVRFKPGQTLPEGAELVYAVNLGLQANKLDHGSGTFTITPSEWDNYQTGSNAYAYKNIWSSWQEGKFIRGTSIKIPASLKRTIEDNVKNIKTSYELNIRPLLIDAKGKVIWEGRGQHVSYVVEIDNTGWSVVLKGQVQFNRGFLADNQARLNQVGGTWKIGLFETDGIMPGTTQWGPLFWSNATGARTPVSIGGTPMVATLSGISSQNATAFYEMPVAITKNSTAIKNFYNYQLIVWFDQTGATPGMSDWTGITPQSNKIDFYSDSASNFRPLEILDMGQNGFNKDRGNLRRNSQYNQGGFINKDANLTYFNIMAFQHYRSMTVINAPAYNPAGSRTATTNTDALLPIGSSSYLINNANSGYTAYVGTTTSNIYEGGTGPVVTAKVELIKTNGSNAEMISLFKEKNWGSDFDFDDRLFWGKANMVGDNPNIKVIAETPSKNFNSTYDRVTFTVIDKTTNPPLKKEVIMLKKGGKQYLIIGTTNRLDSDMRFVYTAINRLTLP